MNNIKTKPLFYILIGVLFLLDVWVWNLSLAEVYTYVEHVYAVPQDKLIVLSQFLNKSSWLKFKIVTVILSVFFGFLSFFAPAIISGFYTSFKYCGQLFREDFNCLTKNQKCFLVVLLICYGLCLCWLSSEFYFQLDELNSWLYFVDRGFLVTISYYPSNNNHIGYNVLCALWKFLLEPTWAMRITSIMSSMGILTLLFLIFIRCYNFLLAGTGIVLLICFSSFSWYAIQGRGYMLALLLLVAIFYLILKNQHKKIDYTIILLSAYTIWIIPVAIIPLSLLMLLAVYINRRDNFLVSRASKVVLSSIALSGLLYLPVFVFSDISTCFTNPFVKHVSHAEAFLVLVKEYLPNIISFLTGMEGANMITFVFTMFSVLILMLVRKSYSVFYFAFIVVGIPSVLFLIYPVLLFERTWLWLLIPLVCVILEMLIFFNREGSKILMICIMFFTFLTVVGANFTQLKDAHLNSKKRALGMEQLRECFGKTGLRTIHIDSDILYTYFRYYQKEDMFILNDKSEDARHGECILLLNNEVEYSRSGEIVCKNSMGTLYKVH